MNQRIASQEKRPAMKYLQKKLHRAQSRFDRKLTLIFQDEISDERQVIGGDEGERGAVKREALQM